jgi:hypothetical protein
MALVVVFCLCHASFRTHRQSAARSKLKQKLLIEGLRARQLELAAKKAEVEAESAKVKQEVREAVGHLARHVCCFVFAHGAKQGLLEGLGVPCAGDAWSEWT